MFKKPRGTDLHVESRARDQARWLIRDHGDRAEVVLAAKIASAKAGSADLYRYRLTKRELTRLRRSERRGGGLLAGLLGHPRRGGRRREMN